VCGDTGSDGIQSVLEARGAEGRSVPFLERFRFRIWWDTPNRPWPGHRPRRARSRSTGLRAAFVQATEKGLCVSYALDEWITGERGEGWHQAGQGGARALELPYPLHI
jgi:hypothetical protein